MDRVLTVTLRGVAIAMKHALAALVDGDRLVNVASDAGTHGVPGMSAHVAAKHGVVGLTRTAAVDHAGRRVRSRRRAGAIVRRRGPAARRRTSLDRAAVPPGRIGTSDEVAAEAGGMGGIVHRQRPTLVSKEATRSLTGPARIRASSADPDPPLRTLGWHGIDADVPDRSVESYVDQLERAAAKTAAAELPGLPAECRY